MQDVRGKRIYVGLSGGVDSAVTAALLKEQGALVTGVFIKGWYPPGMPCTWAADRRDAMRVAARLGVPFKTLDASSEYKEGVIEYMLREYRQGRTPNPDVMCNREVKFKAFAQSAFSEGAEYIATGHYARSIDGSLHTGLDPAKDQSYFLWAVPKNVLQKTLFPLGETRKEDTRKLAKRFNLPNAAKKDSQGVCFLGNISMEDFLISEFGRNEGKALDENGVCIGTHQGALLYTLGSRIALESDTPGPWYVLKKDIEKNELVVSHSREQRTQTRKVLLLETNYFEHVLENQEVEAQFRYHGPRITGTLKESGSVFIPSSAADAPLAPGQSLVLYTADRCIGGGIIG
ncbi:tRNA 2-thiouridine(34) synthase MnmA [Patescibacteria group bacterium]|nr:tRNA 2-thiouridine(34) synthase MnmA [Patescibacteria group bacterium]